MTLSEAITVLKIMATADGWCSTCSTALQKDFALAFPKYADIALNFDNDALQEAYRKKVDENFEKEIYDTNVWELNN